MSEFCVVIPARYASTRLPGKPLLPIAGRPMIAHVCDRAREAGAREVIVATDDERIERAVQALGVSVVLTARHHASGTDRIAEVAELRGFADDTIIVNLQGDEPLMPGAHLVRVAEALAAHGDAGIATLATPIAAVEDVFNPNAVKVVLDDAGYALYFSRAPIPWARGAYTPGELPRALPDLVRPLRHLGLYAYRVATLKRLSRAPEAALERAESLEQLRALALGMRIHVSVITEMPAHGVDTPEDLARVERLLSTASPS